jgi:hypothetical protein
MVKRKTANSKVNKKVYTKKEQDIRNIIFKDINEDYAWGKYGDIKVIIMKDNGYINITHMVHQANPNKRMHDWSRGKNSVELLNEVSTDAEISSDDLLIQISGGKITIIRGTYAHPDLVPHIASWASPKFAVKVSKIVNEYFAKEALKKKDDKIDELRSEVKDISTQNKSMKRILKKISSKNDTLLQQNDEILFKLDFVSNARVVPTRNPEDDHTLIIIKFNDAEEEEDDD